MFFQLQWPNQHVDDRNEENNGDEEGTNNGNQLIFEGSDVTVGQVVTMIYSYALRHSITKLALQDLLKLIAMVLGPNNLPSTIHMLSKYVKSSNQQVLMHFYCSTCCLYIGGVTEDNTYVTCQSCHVEHKRYDLVKAGTFFIVNSMKCQLENLFQDSNIQDELAYKFTREKINLDNVEDICDGRLYKAVQELQNNADNISLSWSTDGVPVFKSSNVSMWPIQCTINELPPQLRRENVLLTGLWFGQGKPEPSVFLKPFVEELNDLAQNGFTWMKPNTALPTVSKVFTLICTCDSVARCALQNVKQFNGKFGCAWCQQEGERVAKGRGHVQVYPFLEELAEDRTHDQTVEDAQEAHAQNKDVRGVKGPSILMLLTTFNIIQGFTVTYLITYTVVSLA